MKKKTLALVLSIILVKLGWAQNTNLDYKSALKIYNLTTFEEQTKSTRINGTAPFRYESTNSALKIIRPTIAFQWKTGKNNFHEIELTNLMLGKTMTKTEFVNDSTTNRQTVTGSDISTTALSVRYEYILRFSESKDRKLVPSVGFGINPYYERNNYSPIISSSFPTSETSLGMRTYLTPRISYFVTSKVFIDVNIPVCVFDSFYLSDKTDNPTIPIDNRTISSFSYNQFPKLFSGRIGVGIKI
jgi:hypothetical protein